MSKNEIQSHGNGNDPTRKRWKLFKDGAWVTLTAAKQQGALHSRPIRASRIQRDGHLWVLEMAAPEAVDGREQRVNISYSSRKNERYVSISGVAVAVRDVATMQEWETRFKAWLPEGGPSPAVSVLRVRVEHVECWDRDARRMVPVVGEMALVPAYAPPASADEATGGGAQG